MSSAALAKVRLVVALAIATALVAARAATAAGFTVTIKPSSSWCTPAPYGAFVVADNDPAYFSFKCMGGFELRGDPSGSATAGQEVYALINAPPGITLTSASAVGDINNVGTGWLEGSFSASGSAPWFSGEALSYPSFSSPYWGFSVTCGSTCGGAGEILLSSITLSATESQGPTLTPVGSENLWLQIRPSEWVWNSPGDPWPLTFAASDPSGVCSMAADVGGSSVPGPSSVPDSSQWQQCPDPTWTPGAGASVDTRDYIPGAGVLRLTLNAINAAGLTTSESETLRVDDDPVDLSVSTPNDASPSRWVNHAVSVDASATAGPSGVGGTSCGVDSGDAVPNSTDALTVDGDGTHNVICTAWNNAVGPQGQPNTTTQSTTVHIDEAPPTIRFEPQNPRDPTAVTVDSGDYESGVATTSVEMAPAGTSNWTALPTSFNGAQMAARFNDAQRSGPYVFKATSCDNVGNCNSSTERLTLPLRIASDSAVSLTKIVNPIRHRTVYERVLVGWHWLTIRRHGKPVRIKVGGHFKTIKVIEVVQPCATKQVKTAAHRWQTQQDCTPVKQKVTSTLQVAYGHRFTIHGLYTTAQGVPMPGQPVHILVAPDDHTNAFRQLTTVTTNSDGSWSATLPPGPSQIIRAVTDGTQTVLPSSGRVTTVVPADIHLLRVWPRHVPWGSTVHLVGQLLGGYLPPGGALVRLRIGYGSTYTTYGVEEHVTGSGRFSTVATFGPGDPSIVRTYWFQIASLPMGNYPYAPAASARVPVTVGGSP